MRAYVFGSRFGLFTLAPGPQAHHIHFILHLWIAEVNLSQHKVAFQSQSFRYAFFAVANMQLGSRVDDAGQNGWLCLDSEIEKILNLAPGNIHVEVDRVAAAFDV